MLDLVLVQMLVLVVMLVLVPMLHLVLLLVLVQVILPGGNPRASISTLVLVLDILLLNLTNQEGGDRYEEGPLKFELPLRIQHIYFSLVVQ